MFDNSTLVMLTYVCIGCNVFAALVVLALETYLACLIWRRMLPVLRNATEILRTTQETVRCASAPIESTAVLCKTFGLAPADLLKAYELDGLRRAEIVDEIFGDLPLTRAFKRRSRFIRYGYAWEQQHIHAIDSWDVSDVSERIRRRQAACARDSILATVLELKDQINATNTRLGTYASAAATTPACSSSTSTVQKRKNEDTNEKTSDTKKAKLECKPLVEVPAQKRGVPVDFRGRAAEDDLVVSLTDPTDPLSPMFNWKAKAKSTGNIELENGVFACRPFFVKHNGSQFDQNYYDFVGRMNPAWYRIIQYEIAQGGVTTKNWFNMATVVPFELLYNSVEDAKNTPAYKALKKVLTNALWINPQLRQLLWQTGKERNAVKILDNPRFIRATGNYPNAGWRGALICGADKMSTEAALSTTVGRNYKAPFMNLWGECLMELRANLTEKWAYQKRNKNGTWEPIEEYGTFDKYKNTGHWKMTDPNGTNKNVSLMLQNPNRTGRGRGRGRSAPRGGAPPTSNNQQYQNGSYYQRGAPQHGRGYNRGSAFSFRGRGSVSATPIQSAFMTTKFDGDTEPTCDDDVSLEEITENLFSEAKSSKEVKNGLRKKQFHCKVLISEKSQLSSDMKHYQHLLGHLYTFGISEIDILNISQSRMQNMWGFLYGNDNTISKIKIFCMSDYVTTDKKQSICKNRIATCRLYNVYTINWLLRTTGNADIDSLNARINELMDYVKRKNAQSNDLTAKTPVGSAPETGEVFDDDQADPPNEGANDADENDLFDDGALFDEETDFGISDSPEPVVQTDTVNSAAPPPGK